MRSQESCLAQAMIVCTVVIASCHLVDSDFAMLNVTNCCVGLAVIMLPFVMRLSQSEHNNRLVTQQEQDLLSLLKVQVRQLDGRFSKLSLFMSASSSYTENKTRVFLNFRKPTGDIYNYDTMMHVLLHELAHVISRTYDPSHVTREFHTNYENLYKLAVTKQLIDTQNIEKYDAVIV